MPNFEEIEAVAKEASAIPATPLHEELVVFEVENPQGHVQVELRDAETGHLDHQDEGHNFISRLWAIGAKSWQHFIFTNPAYQATLGAFPLTDAGYLQDIGRTTVFDYPGTAIACWNDATAEASSTEQKITMDSFGLVAWADKQYASSVDRNRGVVNIAETTYRALGELLVYDWPTNAGNGTFQSIGYTRPRVISGNLATTVLRPSFLDRRYNYITTVLSGASGIFPASYFVGPGGIDSAGNFVTFGTTSISLKMFTLAPGWESGFSPDGMGASLVTNTASVNGNTGTITGASSASTSNYPHFLGESGGFYYGSTAGATPKLFRVNKTTLVVDNIVSLAAAGTAGTTHSVSPGCMIGTDIWISAPQQSTIYRYQTAAMPPTLTATVTLAWPAWVTASFTPYVKAVTTDGTDLYIIEHNTGLWKFNTSGTPLQYWGFTTDGCFLSSIVMRREGQPGGAGTSGLGDLGSAHPYFNAPAGAPRLNLIQCSGLGSSQTINMFYRSGTVWLGSTWATSPTNWTAMGYSDAGWNLGSRVLLGSPVTKANTQTMKIKYDITLPNLV
jgi:hypothetical protein